MSANVWFLVISSVFNNGGVAVIPNPYSSQEECVNAGKQSIDPDGWKRSFVCVPAPSK